jgi:hypothetical protein
VAVDDLPFAAPGATVADLTTGQSWLDALLDTLKMRRRQLGGLIAAQAASRFNQLSPAKATLRTRADILRFFDGLELLEPGLVQVHRWRPGVAVADPNQGAAGYCGLARKA